RRPLPSSHPEDMNPNRRAEHPAVGREVIVFEQAGTTSHTCEVGHRHGRVKVLRRYVLAVIEACEVISHWAAGYGQHQMGHGLRAVDQFGDEWTRDWEGQHSDGPSRTWKTADGRVAEVAAVDGQPVAYDG